MFNIRPSADLRNKYPEMSKLCKESNAPIFITVNGREDTVLMSHRKYAEMQAELKLYADLAEADEDIRMGRVYPADQVFADIMKSIERAK